MNELKKLKFSNHEEWVPNHVEPKSMNNAETQAPVMDIAKLTTRYHLISHCVILKIFGPKAGKRVGKSRTAANEDES